MKTPGKRVVLEEPKGDRPGRIAVPAGRVQSFLSFLDLPEGIGIAYPQVNDDADCVYRILRVLEMSCGEVARYFDGAAHGLYGPVIDSAAALRKAIRQTEARIIAEMSGAAGKGGRSS